LEQLGVQVSLRMRRPGFYPRGGGLVHAHVHPVARIQGLVLRERSAVRNVTGFSAAAGSPAEIAARQARRAVNRLKPTGLKVDIVQETWDGGPGTVLALVLTTQPVPTLFFGLGARGKPAERVADEAVDPLLAYLDAAPAAVDPHSADQLVLPLALAPGPSIFSVSEVTSHLLTNIEVIRRFVDRSIACQGAAGQRGAVQIS